MYRPLSNSIRSPRNYCLLRVFLTLLITLVSCKSENPTNGSEQTDSTIIGRVSQFSSTVFTIRVLPNKDNSDDDIRIDPKALEISIKTLKKRLNGIGVEKLSIKSQGKDRIRLELTKPSDDQLVTARTAIQNIGHLELTLVHPKNAVLADKVAADPENAIVPGYDLKVYRSTNYEGVTFTENILISSRAALDSSYITHAQELYGPQEGTLAVTLNNDGADLMRETTRKMQIGKDRLAIVLDGKVLSAPTVQAILGKKFQITGMNDAKEAKELAISLMTPLTNPLKIEEERSIPAKE